MLVNFVHLTFLHAFRKSVTSECLYCSAAKTWNAKAYIYSVGILILHLKLLSPANLLRAVGKACRWRVIQLVHIVKFGVPCEAAFVMPLHFCTDKAARPLLPFVGNPSQRRPSRREITGFTLAPSGMSRIGIPRLASTRS